MTWDDYRTWPDDERRETIDGAAYAIRFQLTPDGFDKGSVVAPDEVITLATLAVSVPFGEIFENVAAEASTPAPRELPTDTST